MLLDGKKLKEVFELDIKPNLAPLNPNEWYKLFKEMHEIKVGEAVINALDLESGFTTHDVIVAGIVNDFNDMAKIYGSSRIFRENDTQVMESMVATRRIAEKIRKNPDLKADQERYKEIGSRMKDDKEIYGKSKFDFFTSVKPFRVILDTLETIKIQGRVAELNNIS